MHARSTLASAQESPPHRPRVKQVKCKLQVHPPAQDEGLLAPMRILAASQRLNNAYARKLRLLAHVRLGSGEQGQWARGTLYDHLQNSKMFLGRQLHTSVRAQNAPSLPIPPDCMPPRPLLPGRPSQMPGSSVPRSPWLQGNAAGRGAPRTAQPAIRVVQGEVE